MPNKILIASCTTTDGPSALEHNQVNNFFSKKKKDDMYSHNEIPLSLSHELKLISLVIL